ncbi:hypothetical protein DL96DRAFT_1620752 [Flagelloscypha sp. PMI_526]|nr:hypothetical protein DL96DRAFT_1620752 [Flagelloscypha sp. PMI_526]
MLSLSTTPPGIHSVFSNFPASKALPLPGTQPTNMDESYGLTQGGNFTGVVVQFSVLRGFLGIHARSYIVDVRSPSGDTKRNSYAPFLAEITRQDENFDSLTRNECWERRKRFDWIYALIPVDPLPLPKQAARREKTFNLTKNAVWQPVSLLQSMDQAPTFDVVILFGGMAGQVYSDISIVHPYNEGTQKVLRRHGQSVMSETGLVLPPTHFPSGR